MKRSGLTIESIKIEVSEVASLKHGDLIFPAFQMNSYIARVTFPDGFAANIALPPGAASEPFDLYFDRVLANAAVMHSSNVETGYMTEPPPTPLPRAPRP